MQDNFIELDYDSCESGLKRKLTMLNTNDDWPICSEPGIIFAKRNAKNPNDGDFLNQWIDSSDKVFPIKIGDLVIGEATGYLEDGNYSMRIWNRHFLDKIAQESQEAPPNANDRSLHWARAKHRVVRPPFIKDTFHLNPRNIKPLDDHMSYHNLRFKNGKFFNHRTNLLNAIAAVTMDGTPNACIEHKGHVYELIDHVLYVDRELYEIPQPKNGLTYYVKVIIVDEEFVDCFIAHKGAPNGNV